MIKITKWGYRRRTSGVVVTTTTLPYSPSNKVIRNASYSPPVIANGQVDMANVTVTGLILGLPTSITLNTNLSAYPLVSITASVVATGLIKVVIENQSGLSVTLPTLTFITEQ
jgi:hypothetical protein